MAEKRNTIRFIDALILAVLLLAVCAGAGFSVEFPGPAPGVAQVSMDKNEFVLENGALSYTWDISSGRLKPKYVTDKLASATLHLSETQCFSVIMADVGIIEASDLQIVGKPRLKELKPNSESCRFAERFGGRQISVVLVSADSNLNVEWQAVLRDGANYIRQVVSLTTVKESSGIEEIVLVEIPEVDARVMGTVQGSPAVAGNMFFAYESPLSRSQILQGDCKGVRCGLLLNATLKPGESIVQSSATGVVPQGQLRRGFLYYVERERVQPYRPFLHYNSWYDIGYADEIIKESDFAGVIELFGNELIKRRDTAVDSFVLDDGWDDPGSLWRFHKDFPNGFASLQQTAARYNSALGAWLSPFGGYGRAKEQRLKFGKQQGFETNTSGFSLAGAVYYARFRDVCLAILRDYGLSYFKFDGIGSGSRPSGAGPEFAPDIFALMRLISDLRQEKSDVFINITTGMWPSPYWLWYGDSIWRGGADWKTLGAGSKRQQQITYRDNETYHNIVKRAPLYPLNSLMTQGIMFANHGLPDESIDLSDDMQAFFAGGTNCQELYITPSLMQPHHWDALAEFAKWSRDNADVLVDTHWIGGDPAEGEVYGWASWSKRKAVLSLRNPLDKAAGITLDIGKAFELPKGSAKKFVLKNLWKNNAEKPTITLAAGTDHIFELKPFEVLVFNAKPVR